jgi:glycosyltransferase involved in cell wall biosynthesis
MDTKSPDRTTYTTTSRKRRTVTNFVAENAQAATQTLRALPNGSSDLLTYDSRLVARDYPTIDPIISAVRVSVVIPTLNEAENLPHVFERLPRGLHELIIVDGRSSDDTLQVAIDLWPDVVAITQTGKGKGNALSCGFWAATGDVIVMLDADGSTDPQEIPRFVATLLTGADIAKGSRFLTGGGSSDITPTRRLGNWALSSVVNKLWKVRYSDLCYGYNAFWRRCLPQIAPDCNGFEVETLMNIRAARSGLKVHEVPSFEYQRRHGSSNLSACRDGIRVARTIAAERLRPR